MFGPINVCVEGFVHRRIEIDNSRQIHDHVNFAFQLPDSFDAYAAQWLVQIAFYDLNLFPQDWFSAKPFDNWPQRRGPQNLGVKTLLTR